VGKHGIPQLISRDQIKNHALFLPGLRCKNSAKSFYNKWSYPFRCSNRGITDVPWNVQSTSSQAWKLSLIFLCYLWMVSSCLMLMIWTAVFPFV